MPIVNVWLIRHGETDWNAQRRLQGHTDIPLNLNGEIQALSLQEKLSRLNPEVIFTSDLSRALKTAQIANQHLNVPMSVHPELRESLMGEPEGQIVDDVIAKYGKDTWERYGTDLDFAYPGGESPRQTLTRIQSFLAGKFEENARLQNVAVFTHGGVVRRMVTHAHSAPDPIPFFLNCSINHIEFHRVHGRWTFVGAIT